VFIGDSGRCVEEGSGNRRFSPWGNLQAGSFNEDFERWMKKGSGSEVPLRQLCEGNLEGGLLYWSSEGYIKEGSGNGCLSPYWPRWGTVESMLFWQGI